MTTQEIRRINKMLYEQLPDILKQPPEYYRYKSIGTQKFKLKNGIEINSIITLKNGSGQMCHITEDDHCYVLYNQNSPEESANKITHIFPEAFEILKELPSLQQ